jgi:hypothetical protein
MVMFSLDWALIFFKTIKTSPHGNSEEEENVFNRQGINFFYDHSNLEEEGGGGGKTHVGMSLQLTRYKKTQYDKHLHPQ